MAKSKKVTPGKVLGIIGMVVFLIIIVFPFYWLIITALKDPKDISLMPTELWPSRWSLQFFINCFTEHHLQIYLENSIIVALGAMGAAGGRYAVLMCNQPFIAHPEQFIFRGNPCGFFFQRLVRMCRKDDAAAEAFVGDPAGCEMKRGFIKLDGTSCRHIKTDHG